MTNLSGNTLTLGNTSLNEETLKFIKSYYNVPDNCTAGTTVILDGIECLCVATGVTIQGSNLTRIAVDKHHDLGYYQKYSKITMDGVKIGQIKSWRWGRHDDMPANTPNSREVGYGLQNTINWLAETLSYWSGVSSKNEEYPILWQGVNDFRSAHSDKWFVPSHNELSTYVYPYRSSLSFDTTTGGSSTDGYWSSSSINAKNAGIVYFNNGSANWDGKDYPHAVRLCRAF